MTPTIRRRQFVGGTVALLATNHATAYSDKVGDKLGDKVVKYILPVSAGSGVDGIVRAASVELAKALRQTVVIENQPGAGGVVGTAALVKAAPDGLTLSVVSNNHVIYPSVLKSVPFDPLADFNPMRW